MIGLTLHAQPIEYAKGMSMFVSCPEVKTDVQTNKTTVAWYQTNMAWIKDYCEVENVATEKDLLKIFPEIINMPQDEHTYVPMSWRLTSENNETVIVSSVLRHVSFSSDCFRAVCRPRCHEDQWQGRHSQRV
jgi:hypothetical protein